MSIIEHILFPCDFSPQCSLAIPFVHAIASRLGAKVTIFIVGPPLWGAPASSPEAEAKMDTWELAIEPQTRLQTMLAHEFAGLRGNSVVVAGDPALQTIAFAHDNAVDLIMMPTRGYGPVRSLLIGSVTAKVLHDARCPVWTATHAEEQVSASLPRTILCAVDGTPKSVALLHWAGGFTKEMGATLKLIHAAQPISDALALPGERALQNQVNQRARTHVELLARSAAVEAPLEVIAGPVSDVVTQSAQDQKADLVIIGRGSLQSTLGRLRTHGYAIIGSSPCPVLSV
jgi:nucleotide-binding universal stress UspA family protein